MFIAKGLWARAIKFRKQIIYIKHNKVKNPSWQEANQIRYIYWINIFLKSLIATNASTKNA